MTAISQSTRETDVAGWYRDSSVLGVIFTELDGKNPESFTRLTRARLTKSLKTTLFPEEVAGIHISFHLFPDHSDKSTIEQMTRARIHPHLFEEDKKGKLFSLVKRVMDVVVSVVALILCAPLFAAISLAIKLTSKGPILFKQKRIGQYGLPFTFLKFRSMRCGSDAGIHQEYVRKFIAGKLKSNAASAGQNPVYKIQNDPRVTPVGRFLRKTSLDEFPQFINVLRGEMSLVGPRPPVPYEVEAYQPWHRRRICVKPGITGLWQVSGRSKTTFDDMVRLDLRYAKAWSPWLDIKILLRTPWAVFSGEGAY